jgi:hypothetical protein
MNASLGSNTYRPILLVLFAIFALIFISGCAGKKTSSSNEFTSWSAVKPNVLVHFSSGNSTAILTSGTVSQTTSDVNTNLLYDSGNNISSVTLNQTATNSVTFSVAAGDIIVMEPGDVCECYYLEDTYTVVVKVPGVLDDKYIL